MDIYINASSALGAFDGATKEVSAGLALRHKSHATNVSFDPHASIGLTHIDIKVSEI
jgi:hypothetical protein